MWECIKLVRALQGSAFRTENLQNLGKPSRTTMDLYEGKYEHEKTDNFDEFLKEINIPYVFRKLMCASSPTVEVKRIEAEGKWSIVMKTGFKTIEYVFKEGECLESTGFSGSCKNVFTFEGSSIKQEQTNDKYSIEVIREFSKERMIMVIVFG